MRIDPPAKPRGSLIAPLGHVQRQWLPLLSLAFLLVMLLSIANRLTAVDPTPKVQSPKSGDQPVPKISPNRHG